jgi:hypothetical protein
VDFGGYVMTTCYDPTRFQGENRSFFHSQNAGGKGSDSVFHAPQNLEKGGHGVSPCTMHHLKAFSRGLESVLFRTLSYCCRVLYKFLRSDHRKITNLRPMMQIVG